MARGFLHTSAIVFAAGTSVPQVVSTRHSVALQRLSRPMQSKQNSTSTSHAAAAVILRQKCTAWARRALFGLQSSQSTQVRTGVKDEHAIGAAHRVYEFVAQLHECGVLRACWSWAAVLRGCRRACGLARAPRFEEVRAEGHACCG